MSDEAMTLNGQHLAERLIRSQKLSTGSPYLYDEEPPTPTQVGAVLHALADHTLIEHLLSNEMAELALSHANLGRRWQQATAIGRALQQMGNWLEGYNR